MGRLMEKNISRTHMFASTTLELPLMPEFANPVFPRHVARCFPNPNSRNLSYLVLISFAKDEAFHSTKRA